MNSGKVEGLLLGLIENKGLGNMLGKVVGDVGGEVEGYMLGLLLGLLSMHRILLAPMKM